MLAALLCATGCHHASDALLAQARGYLKCPEPEPVLSNGLDFERHDPRRESYSWARYQVEGCKRATWCGQEDEAAPVCRAPEDLELAASQVKVETGCASTVEQLERLDLRMQVTYRLSACGRQYACVVPTMPIGDDATDRLAVGRQLLTCKAVEQPVAAPAP